MPRAWSKKDERQFGHIFQSCRRQGRYGLRRCKSIAGATVNKQRNREGRTYNYVGGRLGGFGLIPAKHQSLSDDAQRTAEKHLDFLSTSASCDEALNTLMHARASVAAMVEHQSSITPNAFPHDVRRDLSKDKQRTLERFSRVVEQFRYRCLPR